MDKKTFEAYRGKKRDPLKAEDSKPVLGSIGGDAPPGEDPIVIDDDDWIREQRSQKKPDSK